MFAETVTTPRSAADTVWERSRLFSEPPTGLVAAIAWESGDDDVTTVMVWETPGARGDFAAERMVPLYEAGILGAEHGHPDRVTPVQVYVRAAEPGAATAR